MLTIVTILTSIVDALAFTTKSPLVPYCIYFPVKKKSNDSASGRLPSPTKMPANCERDRESKATRVPSMSLSCVDYREKSLTMVGMKPKLTVKAPTRLTLIPNIIVRTP